MRFLTVCNDEFAPGLAVLIASLERNYKGFSSIPFRVLFHERFAPLRPEFRTLLTECFPNVEFVSPDVSAYTDAPTVNDQADNSAYLTLEAFNQLDCERVVFLDSDLFVIRDFSEVLDIDHPFIACRAGGQPRAYPGPDQSEGMINTGVFVLGSSFLDGSTYRELIGKVKDNAHTLLRDQALINELISVGETHVLPDHFNFRAWDHLAFFAKSAPNIRIIHFSGYSERPKPWANEASLDVLAYRMWIEYALTAVERFPQLSPILPFSEEKRRELSRWQGRTGTALGMLESLATDVKKDWADIMVVHGDTTFNRLRQMTPGWVTKAARGVFGGKPSDKNE